MLNAPKSENARGPPIIGMDSRLDDGLKSLPLLLRLSRARLTSVDYVSVKMQSKLWCTWMLGTDSCEGSQRSTRKPMRNEQDTPSICMSNAATSSCCEAELVPACS